MSYVVIYDTVAWTTGSVKENDLVYCSAARGEELPKDAPADKIKQWLDPKLSPPHGAIAEQGSELAKVGSSGASVAMDPAEARRIFHDAAGASVVLVDPARDPSDEEKTKVDAGVAASRSLAGRGTGTADIAPPPAGQSSERLDVDSMSKTQLETMADALGVDHSKTDTKDELRDKIRAHGSDS